MTKRSGLHPRQPSQAQAPRPELERRLRETADGLERFLKFEPRSRVLHLACGSGRQTLELARRGHRVLGLDASGTLFAAAREAARDERLNLHFIKGDMRQISYRAEFDAVVCLGSAFGRYPHERDDLRALEAARRGLKPGGRLLLDLLNKEWLIRRFDPGFWEPPEDHHASAGPAALNLETGRLECRRASSIESLRVYTLTEIKSLIELAGLSYRRAWGGFDGRDYGLDSHRLVVLAERPHEPHPRPRNPEDDLPRAIKIKGRR